MEGNDAERAAVANPDRRHRPVVNGAAKTKAGRRPNPPVRGRENPTAIVIWQPTPRSGTDKRIAEERILIPAAVTERRPAEAHSKRPPAIAVAAHRKPGTVSIKIAEACRIVRRIHILRGVVRGGHNAVNAPGNPAVEIVGVRSTPNHRFGGVARMHRERLAFVE